MFKPTLKNFGKLAGLEPRRVKHVCNYAPPFGKPPGPKVGELTSQDLVIPELLPGLKDPRRNVPPEWQLGGVQPMNGDPFVGGFETPISSDEQAVWLISNLPGYAKGADPVLRGVELGLANCFWLPGPFIKLSSSVYAPENPELYGCIAGFGVVLIGTLFLIFYGWYQFADEWDTTVPLKTLSGRETYYDPAFTTDKGFQELTGGFLVGGILGVAWCYILTQTLPFYHLPGFY